MPKAKYQRVLLKLSGEAFRGERKSGIDFEAVSELAKEIAAAKKTGLDIVVVNGAGNLFRGKSSIQYGVDRATADYMGMLATIMNSLALMDALEREKFPTRVMSAIEAPKVAEPYIRRKAIRHMEKGRIVICAGGMGCPFFTTDTAGVLRSIELNCQIMLKASDVDGVYDDDPKENTKASRFENLSYAEVLSKHLKVIDATAVSLARENNLPIEIFDFFKKGNLQRVILGQRVGTLIS